MFNRFRNSLLAGVTHGLLPLDGAAAQPEPLPPFVERLSSGDYLEERAQLATRDGRVIGNAAVVKVQTYHDRPLATIVTDAGTVLEFTQEELQDFFHPPRFVLKTVIGLTARAAR